MHGIALAQCTPVLGIDLWEHAYFRKFEGDKAMYFEAFWQHINWDRVSTYFERFNLKNEVAPIVPK